MMKKWFKPGLLIGLAMLAIQTVQAKEAGDWVIRFGGSYIEPKSNNSEIVSVDGQMGVTFNFSYFMTRNLAVEVLAALPYEHDINLVNGPKVASTKHLPPTASIQYHFLPEGRVQPYLGLGVNYTLFFSEDTTGPLAGANLKLEDSWGWAGEVGMDIPMNDKWLLNFSARYIDIDTDARLDGASLGTVSIDPWVYGAHLGIRF